MTAIFRRPLFQNYFIFVQYSQPYNNNACHIYILNSVLIKDLFTTELYVIILDTASSKHMSTHTILNHQTRKLIIEMLKRCQIKCYES